jgi:hypothetical protein
VIAVAQTTGRVVEPRVSARVSATSVTAVRPAAGRESGHAFIQNREVIGKLAARLAVDRDRGVEDALKRHSPSLRTIKLAE